MRPAGSAKASSKATPPARCASCCASSSCCRSPSREVAQKEAEAPERRSRSSRRISAADLALFTRQLATLVRAGLPLEESLLAVSQQTEKPRVQSIILGVRSRVMEGHTLADGFAEFPRVFPEIYRATVSAGEQSGHLDNVLERLADYTESREQMRQKVLGAMLYPIVLTVMCFGIVSGLLVYVVPQGGRGVRGEQRQAAAHHPRADRHQRFPARLRHLAADRHRGASVLFVRWLRNPAARRRFHRLLLRLPLIGKLTRGFNTARFTRTLSILTASAVPVLEALRIAERSGHQPADARCRDRSGAARARGRAHRPLARREQAVPADDAFT